MTLDHLTMTVFFIIIIIDDIIWQSVNTVWVKKVLLFDQAYPASESPKVEGGIGNM